ncbi:MAG: S-layer homology domain-containing protein, partial [Candidatus Ornithomonoglobus sp.]
MKIVKRTLSVMLAAAVAAGSGMTAVYAENGYATRGEVCQMLLAAADDYNPTVEKSDILQGYDDGSLHEEWNVTRAEAVVMLSRAFGELPELKGYNEYLAIPKESFTDIPAWADDELNSVFDAGIIAGKDDGIFAPDDNVTKDEMNLWIQRVYALFGTNLKDNFFTAVNHDDLENLEFGEGQFGTGKIYDVDEEVRAECLELIKKAARSDAAANTPEGKIKILYNNITDKASRNKDGIAPVKPYLDKLDSAKNIDDIVDFCLYMYKETARGGFFGFELTEDAKDSNVYITQFSTVSAPLPKEAYTGEADYLKNAYLNYIKTICTLAGDSEADAEKNARTVWDIDSALSEAALKPEEYYDVSKVYNIYSLQQLDEIYETVDLQKVFDEYGYKNKDKICVTDVGVMKRTAELMTDENAENLKIYLRCALLNGSAACLGTDFEDASQRFSEEAYGITGRKADDLKAAEQVSSYLSIYVDMLYKDAYYSRETEENVTKIINDAIDVYKDKI